MSVTATVDASTCGFDLTKQFSDGQRRFENVRFLLHNDTDNYYVQVKLTDGVFFVTGHTDKEASATVFTPNSKGHILIKGLKDDAYTARETATDAEYTLLRECIRIFVAVQNGTIREGDREPMITASSTVTATLWP